MALPTYTWAAGADPLNAATMAAIAAGVSTRRYAGTLDELPPGEASSAISKSAVSRRFVALSQQQLDEWLHRRLHTLDLPVVMIDGIHFRERVILVALGIDAQGNKHVLGLREGSTEATRVVASLLSELIDRGLDAQRMRLWVIDGGKALRKAIVETFGVRRSSSAARSTSAATSSSICPRTCTPASTARCVTPGAVTTRRWPASSCSAWPARCRAGIRARRPASGRGSRRR